MKLSIDISEQRLKNILSALVKNPKTKPMAIELSEIYNFLLAEISQKQVDIDQATFMYNDLRENTIKRIHIKPYLRGLNEGNKEITKLIADLETLSKKIKSN